MTFESLLVHSIYKRTLTSSQNMLGEWIYTYADGSIAVSCRINPISNRERIDAGGRWDDVRYICYMDYSESINTGDHVTYGGNDYRMKEVVIDSSSHNRKGYMVELIND